MFQVSLGCLLVVLERDVHSFKPLVCSLIDIKIRLHINDSILESHVAYSAVDLVPREISRALARVQLPVVVLEEG